MDNGLVLYYDTTGIARVRKLSLRVVSIKFRKVVMSAFHISPQAAHNHEKRKFFRILACFLWPMVYKDVAQLIRAYVNFQLVNSCSHKAHHLPQTIESDNPFNVVFIDLWGTGDIPYWDGSLKNATNLDCMTGFGIGASNGLKEIT